MRFYGLVMGREPKKNNLAGLMIMQNHDNPAEVNGAIVTEGKMTSLRFLFDLNSFRNFLRVFLFCQR
jgi:hypothetical protein